MTVAIAPPFEVRIVWHRLIGVLICHLGALLALLPYFFSWAGVVAAVVGYYVFAMLGINIGYHRLLAHRSFSSPRWLEHSLALLGLLALQFGPAFWVALHRRHHQDPDGPLDPHSPSRGFWWAHTFWFFTNHPNNAPGAVTRRYSPDLMGDKFYAWLESHGLWFWLVVVSWGVYFAAGYAAEMIAGKTQAEAVRLGGSLVVWGVFVRTVVVWHITWSVNSVSHIWGHRRYDTADNSRNNPWVGVLAHGEGWHNNHHADPRSARHGHKWWEFDPSWWVILLLGWVGLAADIAKPRVRRFRI